MNSQFWIDSLVFWRLSLANWYQLTLQCPLLSMDTIEQEMISSIHLIKEAYDHIYES